MNFGHKQKTTGLWLISLILIFASFSLFYFHPFSASANPTPTPNKSTAINDKSIPKVTVIPNPARGKKLDFRIMTNGPSKVRIRVYNRFFDIKAKLEKEGNGLFDILWSLKDVSEGIYLFQAQIEDETTGQINQLPLQKFVVLKTPR